MNFHLSWIAVKGPGKDQVLATLGLVEAPEDDDPAYFKHSVAELPSGWVIILAEDFMYPTPKRMAAVSVGGTAIACSVDERTMYSVARGYADGKAVWSVDHDGGQQGVYHLDVAGSPPPEFVAIRDRLKAKQDQVDGEAGGVDYVFDVPVEMSQAFCGYRYDEELDPEPMFKCLEPVKAKGGGWLKRLFGRG